ncbi:ABC transporter permease [Micromonospora echinofusca]|uniref:ABC transporter permease n=1 Tax=Micromonospora echinofusca TaxID=47858 RepID=A0ABS3VKC8_MICEH|nr:ABC transporter permease [Micromonospora echinofusca]MBO4204903.1 ABC transporter permease [Micromonospora echinofusca]
MNLVRAELERLTARRFVQLMVVLLIAAFGITIATTLASSHRPTQVEVTRAEQQAATARQEMVQAYQNCLAARAAGVQPGQDGYPANCAEMDPARSKHLPSAGDFLYQVFVFDQQIRPLLYFLIAFLMLFAFLVGASYIGADLTSGGMTNLLLWRPQRMTVLGTKLGALLGTVLVVSVLSSLLYLGAFWLIAVVGGLVGDPTATFWTDLSLTYLRGLVLVLMAGTLGFSVATLGRHTAAALGTFAGYVVLWELGARVVFEIIEVARPDQWMLSSYLGAWLVGRVEFWDNQACRPIESFCDGMYEITWRGGLLVLTLLVAGAVAASFTAFRRRDLA